MKVRRLVVFLATLFALQCAALHAQNPAGASPPAKFKALWEPVNFGQDINLADVAFTSGEVGWAVGAKSTILHTKDGGKTWEVQLGGDPGSGDRDLKGVFFLDSSHGWVRGTGDKLFSTTDGGKSWEDLGRFSVHWIGPAFIDPKTGFAATGEVGGGAIQRTADGGKSWEPVFRCSLSTEVNGLARTLPCAFKQITFASPRVGFALASFPNSGLRATAIARTVDGGESWSLARPENLDADPEQIMFWNESEGLITLFGGKTLRTEDGGLTWKGVVAPWSDGRVRLGLAKDKAAAAGIWYKNAYYSSNGGRSFTSRPFPAPAAANAVAVPDSRHAYAVGNHGMIYRYIIVPIDYQSKGMIGAPAL